MVGDTDKVALIGWELSSENIPMPIFERPDWRVAPGMEHRFIPHGGAGLRALGRPGVLELELRIGDLRADPRLGESIARTPAVSELHKIAGELLGILRIVLEGVSIYRDWKREK